MAVAETFPSGMLGEAPRYVCRSPGCLGSSLASDATTWIGGGGPRQPSAAPEVLGAPPAEPSFAAPSTSSGTTWLGASSYAAEPPRRSMVRERSTSQSSTTGHEFEDGICLHCGRVERLAGRYGWSCPVRLP